jgi:hypothetical protein
MSDPEFVYTDATHEYRLVWADGREEILPSVTQVIDAAGLVNEFSKQEYAALRGSRAHEAGKYLFEQRLDWTSVDERILGYVQSLDKWIKLTGFVAERCEVRLYHPILKFAGSFDCIGHLPDGSRVIADLKTGTPDGWHGVQLAGYMILLGGYRRRGGLYLQKDGDIAKWKEYEDPMDESNFISLLNVYRLKKEMGK